MELTGKRIIVTGAARGLGKYMAIACIRSGAQVLRTATDRYALEETVGESQAAADQAVIHLADVGQAAQVDTIVDAAQRAFGGVDVLFNNAGIGTGSIRPDFWENPIKFWDRALPPAQVALAAAAPVAWTGFGDQMRVSVGGMPAPKQQ